MAVSEPSQKTAKVNNLRLNYLDWGGDGKPLILLHGLTGNAGSWIPFVRDGLVSSTEYRILALDQRGHGDSDRSDDYSIGGFIADIAGFARYLGLEKFDLLGHSMGARHAMAFAGEYHELLDHLILVDFGPEMERSGAADVRTRTTTRPAGFNSLEQAADYLETTTPNRTREQLLEQAKWALRLNYANKYVWKHDPEIQWISGAFGLKEIPFIWGEIAKAQCKTLIVRGETSGILGKGVMQRMLDVMPNAKAVEIEGADHGVPQDQPERFWAAVNEFLKS